MIRILVSYNFHTLMKKAHINIFYAGYVIVHIRQIYYNKSLKL